MYKQKHLPFKLFSFCHHFKRILQIYSKSQILLLLLVTLQFLQANNTMKNKKIDDGIKKIRDRIAQFCHKPNLKKEAYPQFLFQSEKQGILFIHGIDDEAQLMQEIFDYFKIRGFTVYNITLPGRGQNIEDLANTTWQEWVAETKFDYQLLSRITQSTYIIGFSTGATVALKLTEELTDNDQPTALLLLSPAIHLIAPFIPLSFTKRGVEIMCQVKPFTKKIDNYHLIFRDEEARKKYARTDRKSSSRAILELICLMENTKKNIQNITCPVLIMQSKKDVVVCPSGANWLNKNLSTDKSLIWLNKSGHPIMVDLEKQTVFAACLDFIKKWNNYEK